MKKIGKSPIFILGCQRSGTTLLRLILDSHSRIACPPESKFLYQLVNIIKNEQSYQSLKSMGFSHNQILNNMKNFIEAFFLQYCSEKGKIRWADKNPHNLFIIDILDEMFAKQALYIAIVRHGLDVVCSLSEFSWGIIQRNMENEDNKYKACLKVWCEMNNRLLDFQKKVKDRLILIKYEDLTENPKAVIQYIYEFLGENIEMKTLNYSKFTHDYGYGDEKACNYSKIELNSQKYLTLPLDMQKELFNYGKNIFQKLGYTI